MCYMTILSTTADTDLSVHNNELVTFTTSLPGIPEEQYLTHKFKWFIGSQSGCSCEFRHLYVDSVSLGFGEPEDWLPEEPGKIEATRQISAVIRSLVKSGAEVDCVDAWAHDQDSVEPLAGEIEVDLSEISDSAFRFFEMHRFTFTASRWVAELERQV
jgi:hypothetical protein